VVVFMASTNAMTGGVALAAAANAAFWLLVLLFAVTLGQNASPHARVATFMSAMLPNPFRPTSGHAKIVSVDADAPRALRRPGMSGVAPRLAVAVALLAVGCSDAMPPLHEAALTGNTEAIKTAIAAGRTLDAKWNEPTRGLEGNYARLVGLTPLMMAARSGQLEAARLLVDGGADLYAQVNTQLPGEPRTAFDLAVEADHTAVAEYLWSRSDGVRFGARLAAQIAGSCSRLCNDNAGSDPQTNLALFLIGIVRDQTVLGEGIGLAACYSQRPVELLEFVANRVARIPSRALHCMAFQSRESQNPLEKRLAVVSWLLDHGADPNDRSFAWTPLMGAAAAPDLAMVKSLIAHGADPNLPNAEGLTPIGAAANSCVHLPSADIINEAVERQRAMVEFLATISDRAVYTSPAARSRLALLGQCCVDQPQTPAQRRICEIFGM
jgi:ankyrin repeat protein